MGVYPRKYKKEEFNKFLKENDINDTITKKFSRFPEKIIRNGDAYALYINSTWYSIGSTWYSFELNYYCEDKIEFLFSLKVFNDVELSINNLIYELININILKK